MKERSSFLAFVRSNQTALWKISYFVIAAFLFAAAAQKRFSWPQVPLANKDPGYLWPALMKLNGDAFAHIQGLNFLYPGMVYVILRTWGDFRAISVIQHFLGLIAVLYSSRAGADWPISFPNLVWAASSMKGSDFGAPPFICFQTLPILLEMRIRSDALCMFFEALVFWLIIQFFY